MKKKEEDDGEGEGGGGEGGSSSRSSDDDDSEQLYDDLDEFSIGYKIATRVEEHEFTEVLNRDLSHLILGDWIL